MNLAWCEKITDASVIEIAKGCSRLSSINFVDSRNITDASVIERAKGCSQVITITLAYCDKVTDVIRLPMQLLMC